jgi:predicted lipoprotein
MILRCEETGRCWQVEFWPDAGPVALKRGELVITVPRETVFELYTEVC